MFLFDSTQLRSFWQPGLPEQARAAGRGSEGSGLRPVGQAFSWSMVPEPLLPSLLSAPTFNLPCYTAFLRALCITPSCYAYERWDKCKFML